MSDEITNGNNEAFTDSVRQVYIIHELIRKLININKKKIKDIECNLVKVQSAYSRNLLRLHSKLRKSKDPFVKYKLNKQIVSSRRIHTILVSDLNSTLIKERRKRIQLGADFDEFEDLLEEIHVSNDSFTRETYNTSYFFTSFVDVYGDSTYEPRFWNEEGFLLELSYMYTSGIPFASIIEWSLFDTISVQYKINDVRDNNHVNV